jgi:hypothetical protein
MSVDIRFFNAGEAKSVEEARTLLMETVADLEATFERGYQSTITMADGGNVFWIEIDQESETTIALGHLSLDVCRFLYALASKTEWVIWSDLVPHSILRPVEQIELPVTRSDMEPWPEAIESPEVLHSLYSKELARRAKILDEVREHVLEARQQLDKF